MGAKALIWTCDCTDMKNYKTYSYVFVQPFFLFMSLAPRLCVRDCVSVTFGRGVRAVQSRPTPQLSPKGVTGAGPPTGGNDAEPVNCGDDRTPDAIRLAPKSKGGRDSTSLTWGGVLFTQNNRLHQRALRNKDGIS